MLQLPQGQEVFHCHYKDLLDYEEGQAGLRAVPKLTKAHIFPNAFQKMSVKLAVQASHARSYAQCKVYFKNICSNILGSKLKTLLFHTFYSCSVRVLLRPWSFIASRKTARSSMGRLQHRNSQEHWTSCSTAWTLAGQTMFDSTKHNTLLWDYYMCYEVFFVYYRWSIILFQVLKDSIAWLDNWEKYIKTLPTERQVCFLSKQTCGALRLTLHSSVALIENLLLSGFRYVLVGNFGQDPLEVNMITFMCINVLWISHCCDKLMFSF